jgi:hypothetical protein
VLKEGKITRLALYKYLLFTRESKQSVCLGTAENFQIWRAVLTYDQPKMSSFSVIGGYVWILSLKFFQFHHESLIKFAVIIK